MKFTIKEYTWHALGTTVLGGLLCVLLGVVCINSSFFDPVSKALGRISFTDTYFYLLNSAEDAETDFSNNVVLVDMNGCQSRAEIAAKLDELTACNPAVVGMDAMFGNNSMTGKTVDDSLMHAAKRCKQLITAYRVVPTVDGFTQEHSYFIDSTGTEEACINVESDVWRNYNLELEFDTLKVKTFVGKILEKAYPDIYDKLKSTGNNDFLINFKGIMFDTYAFADSLYPEDIEGKIVLMGDFEDLRDYHDVPTTADGQTRINGTLVHAYSIATATQGRQIDKMSNFWGMILGVILTYIFAFVCSIIFVELDELSGLYTNAFLLFVLVTLCIVGGIIFIKYQYELNLVTAMLGIGAVGTTNEIWFWLCTTRPYIKIQTLLGLPDGGVRQYVNTSSNGTEAALKKEESKETTNEADGTEIEQPNKKDK